MSTNYLGETVNLPGLMFCDSSPWSDVKRVNNNISTKLLSAITYLLFIDDIQDKFILKMNTSEVFVEFEKLYTSVGNNSLAILDLVTNDCKDYFVFPPDVCNIFTEVRYLPGMKCFFSYDLHLPLLFGVKIYANRSAFLDVEIAQEQIVFSKGLGAGIFDETQSIYEANDLVPLSLKSENIIQVQKSSFDNSEQGRIIDPKWCEPSPAYITQDCRMLEKQEWFQNNFNCSVVVYKNVNHRMCNLLEIVQASQKK